MDWMCPGGVSEGGQQRDRQILATKQKAQLQVARAQIALQKVEEKKRLQKKSLMAIRRKLDAANARALKGGRCSCLSLQRGYASAPLPDEWLRLKDVLCWLCARHEWRLVMPNLHS